MNLPDTLPQRMYLLACSPSKGRARAGGHLGKLIRAAALADLYLNGHLTDDRGKAVVDVRHPCRDPYLETVLEEIAASRPRKWQHWVGRRGTAAYRAVRDQLAADGWIRLERRKILGLFPYSHITQRDPRVRRHLVSRISTTLRTPLSQIDPADAALVALAAASDLRIALDRSTRRTNKRRITDLTTRTGPAAPALKKSIAAANAAAAG